MNDATHGPALGVFEVTRRFGGLLPLGLSALCVVFSVVSWGYGMRADVTTGPQASEFRNWATLLSLYALGIGAICLVWLMITGRKIVEAIRARKFGAAEQAEVIEVRKVREWALKADRSITGYVLVWRDRSGDRRKSLQSNSDQRYDAYPPGTKIEVFRDSRGRTWWVGDVGPRREGSTVPSVTKS